ncbi:hypothetical protein SB860_37200, partial [Burkholderia sp. SIMBA_019]
PIQAPIQAQPPSPSLPPEGVAEALRMLNAASQPPTASTSASMAAPEAAQPKTKTNGKVPPQQVGVLGSGSAPN